MAEFNITIGSSKFNVVKKDVIETDNSSIFTYDVFATDLDLIDIRLVGSQINEEFTLNGTTTSFSNTVIGVSYLNSLEIKFAVPNSGVAGVFLETDLTITDTSITGYNEYTETLVRENDNVTSNNLGGTDIERTSELINDGEDTTSPFITQQQASAQFVEEVVAGANIVIDKTDPENYIISALGATTAGILSRIYLTGDETITSEGTFYLIDTEDRGTVASVSQVVVNNDNTKTYFSQDVLGGIGPVDVTFQKGYYSGHLAVTTSSNQAQQRFTLEIYKADVDGVVMPSGIVGNPIGDLGVEVVAILDSGIIDIPNDTELSIPIVGTLLDDYDIVAGERTRIHISGEKVGTAGGDVTLTAYFGQDHNSYIEVPSAVTTDTVLNVSNIVGVNTSEALETLDTKIDNLAAVDISYDNSTSNLEAIEVQAAIDELEAKAAGGLERGKFKFDATTSAADPTKGKLRFNSSTPASITEVYIDTLSVDDTDITFFIEGVNVGDKILIQQQDDATKYVIVEATGPPINNTGWWTIPVLYDSGVTLPVDNKELLVVVRYFNLVGGDADTLDGQDGPYYLNWNNFTNIPPSIAYTDVSNLFTTPQSIDINLGEIALSLISSSSQVGIDFVDADNTGKLLFIGSSNQIYVDTDLRTASTLIADSAVVSGINITDFGTGTNSFFDVNNDTTLSIRNRTVGRSVTLETTGGTVEVKSGGEVDFSSGMRASYFEVHGGTNGQFLKADGNLDNNKYTPLNSFDKIPNQYLPALAITDTFVVSSEAEMLSLVDAETGDVAVRTDINKSYILQGTAPSILVDWQELLTPTDSVQSVNGLNGVVVIDPIFAGGQLSITGGGSVNLDGRYSQLGHTHTISEITDFPTNLAVTNLDNNFSTDQSFQGDVIAVGFQGDGSQITGIISDLAFDNSWDGDTQAPTKNAVYDVIGDINIAIDLINGETI